MTITHNSLDLTVQTHPALALVPPIGPQDPTPPLVTSGGHHWGPVQTISPPLLLVTPGGHHWRSVQTRLLQDPPPTSGDIWWLLKQVRSAYAGGYVSYWNAFLLFCKTMQ